MRATETFRFEWDMGVVQRKASGGARISDMTTALRRFKGRRKPWGLFAGRRWFFDFISSLLWVMDKTKGGVSCRKAGIVGRGGSAGVFVWTEGGGGVTTVGKLGRTGGGGLSCLLLPKASSRSPNSSTGAASSRGGADRPTPLDEGRGGSSECGRFFSHHWTTVARTKRAGTIHSMRIPKGYLAPGFPESLAMAERISVSAETLRIFW